MAIESLAPETLIHILKIVSQLEFQQDEAVYLHNTILKCAEVSRRWRSIVLGAPTLFTHFIISFGLLKAANCNMHKCIGFWLEHSKPLPVTILLRFLPPFSDPAGFTAFHDLWNTSIAPNIYRFGGIHFQLPHPEITPPYTSFSLLSPLERVHAPTLNNIVIQRKNSSHCVQAIYPPFKSTPNLRKVVVRGSDIFPLTKELQELNIHHFPLSDTLFRELASDCQRLEVLSLWSISLIRSSPLGERFHWKKPIEMNSLRSLILEFRDAQLEDLFELNSIVNHRKSVLTYVLAPSLEYLEVCLNDLKNINLANILPDPSSLTSLRKLKLLRIPRRVQGATAVGDMDHSTWFRNLPTTHTIEEIHLSHSSGDVLGIDFPFADGDDLGLQNSHMPVGSDDIYYVGWSRSHESGPLVDPSTGSFKNLKTVTLDTFEPENMVWLCRLLSVRPTIQTVWLTTLALSTLRRRLVLLEDEELGAWFIKIKKQRCLAFILGHDEEKGFDAEKWVKERVELKVYEAS
ncbi:hypothetical protein E1B28_013018 [Marasmius oreades]|uniref:F-box domain-containing protein n=1 Tax=Marasmius oreades TaxID=181124 RepID=A0A9P7RNW6_9AGAR|nr:uncharacterized protein E1B28_013018 [Marasmius oreades]KAG7087039.1 hypothetical protein E1B28_013018 [Marasmius oreades]